MTLSTSTIQIGAQADTTYVLAVKRAWWTLVYRNDRTPGAEELSEKASLFAGEHLGVEYVRRIAERYDCGLQD